jgi:Flp pilus assembly protein TadG
MFWKIRMPIKRKDTRIKGETIHQAQAIVEFAIALPILLVLVVGIFEVGRYLFIFSAVNNASREAARYGSAWGVGDTGTDKYEDCASIRSMARRSAFFLNLPDNNITIQYDHGPGTGVYDTCNGATDNIAAASEDRVLVTVTTNYTPMLDLIPLEPRAITSMSARTIIGIIQLQP